MYCSILAMIFPAKIIFFYYTVSSIFRFQVNYIKKKAWSMEKNSDSLGSIIERRPRNIVF